jgi:alkanesulfonate monooxygenase SsuD/methylene tetrahydromethanopterin reductase-like flavin-dependent oxidoreductase (luciferase family)
MTKDDRTISIGVAGTLGPELIGELAREVEHAGFHSLWVNDTPGGDSLAALAAAARTTEHLVLGTGVLPVDRLPATHILRGIRNLPEERTVLGLGSGQAKQGALARVRDTIRELRARSSARLLVGALGPRMRHLAAKESDGALFNWLTPDVASSQVAELNDAAPGAHAVLYVRTAFDPAASDRLEAEIAAYSRLPAYAANFERLTIDPADTVLRPEHAADRIRQYRCVADELVLRAVTPGDRLDDYLRFVTHAVGVIRP